MASIEKWVSMVVPIILEKKSSELWKSVLSQNLRYLRSQFDRGVNNETFLFLCAFSLNKH